MNRRYQIDTETLDLNDTSSNPVILKFKKGDYLEDTATNAKRDTFGVANEDNSIWPRINKGLQFIFGPLQKPLGVTNLVFAALFVIFLSIIRKIFFLLPLPIKEPFLRGWRLEVVKNVALYRKNPVPSIRPDLLVKYYFKGLVLMVMRYIYFIPLVIVAFLSGKKILILIKEIFFYMLDLYNQPGTNGIGDFIGKKVLPQAGMEILIQLVLLGFYVVLVWPIYRIIMIQYALNLTNAFGFINLRTISNSIQIFRYHALEVYGVYGFVVAVDIFVGWFATVATFFSFGLFWLIAPVYYLVMRYWVVGFAYGILGRRLIEAGALAPTGYIQPYEESDEFLVQSN